MIKKNAVMAFLLGGSFLLSACQPKLLDEPLSPEASLAIEQAKTADIEMGYAYEKNIDADPQSEFFYYRFPTYEVSPDVFLTQTYGIENFDEQAFRPVIYLAFRNMSDSEQAFVFNLQVPKAFAEDIDQLLFSLEPSEIINRDVDVNFNLAVPPNQQVDQMLSILSIMETPPGDPQAAKEKMMQAAYQEKLKICNESKFPDAYDRQVCYYDLVHDFKGYINADELDGYCDELEKTVSARCRAILHDDPDLCKVLSNPMEYYGCRQQFIDNLCRLEDEVERTLCLSEKAIQFKTAEGCILIEENDLRMDCLARTQDEKSLCQKIQDEELKQRCLVMVRGEGESEEDWRSRIEQFLYGLLMGDGKAMFPSRNAQAMCERFTSLSSNYPVIKKSGTGDSLTCYYGTPKDQENKDWRYVLFIKQYPDEASAIAYWTKNNGPDAWWISTLFGNPDILIHSDMSETAYLYAERITWEQDDQVRVSVTLHAGERYGRYLITLSEHNVEDDGANRWQAALQQAKQLIGEREN